MADCLPNTPKPSTAKPYNNEYGKMYIRMPTQEFVQEPLKVLIKPTGCGVSEMCENKYGTCRGPGLTSRHSHGDSQSPVTPGSGDPILPSDFCGLLSCAYGAHKYTRAHTNTHKYCK